MHSMRISHTRSYDFQCVLLRPNHTSNSWDRQPYVHGKSADGTPQLLPDYNELSQNLMVANYQAGTCIE